LSIWAAVTDAGASRTVPGIGRTSSEAATQRALRVVPPNKRMYPTAAASAGPHPRVMRRTFATCPAGRPFIRS